MKSFIEETELHFTRRAIVRYCTKSGKEFYEHCDVPNDYNSWEYFVFVSETLPNIRCPKCGAKTIPISLKEYKKITGHAWGEKIQNHEQ